MNIKKQASMKVALVPVVFLIASIMLALVVFDLGEVHIALFISAIFAAIISHQILGYTWAELEEGIVDTIKMSMGAILVMFVMGMVVGTWILSGIVPAMIFYGLKILSPSIFLVAACLISCIVSLATGSSWTTAATVGIALIGVGTGLGVPIEMSAGAIISGAYFGDKMSPLSDTTNLAPAMAGAKLFDHIRHMIFTTGPSLIISLVLFAFLGMQYAGKSTDVGLINEIIEGLSTGFNINPVLLVAPCLVIAMVVFKVPAIPGLFSAAALGGLFAVVFQGTDVGTVLDAMNNGYASATGNAFIDDLLSRGGLQSMLWTVSLVICAMTYGGVMERTGMLKAISDGILKLANSVGSLTLATVLSCIALNMIAGDQYLAIVIPGRMYKEAYDEKGLHPKNLSRALEDSGTLTSPLIPWNTCGAYMITTLGLTPWTYVPYCFLNLINPLISVFYGYTGLFMTKANENDIIEESAI